MDAIENGNKDVKPSRLLKKAAITIGVVAGLVGAYNAGRIDGRIDGRIATEDRFNARLYLATERALIDAERTASSQSGALNLCYGADAVYSPNECRGLLVEHLERAGKYSAWGVSNGMRTLYHTVE